MYHLRPAEIHIIFTRTLSKPQLEVLVNRNRILLEPKVAHIHTKKSNSPAREVKNLSRVENVTCINRKHISAMLRKFQERNNTRDWELPFGLKGEENEGE